MFLLVMQFTADVSVFIDIHWSHKVLLYVAEDDIKIFI